MGANLSGLCPYVSDDGGLVAVLNSFKSRVSLLGRPGSGSDKDRPADLSILTGLCCRLGRGGGFRAMD